MSYCRFSEGDVYLYATFGNKWHCAACRMDRDLFETRVLDSEEDVLAHLEHHTRAGHKVPKHAFQRIKKEIRDRQSAAVEREQ